MESHTFTFTSFVSSSYIYNLETSTFFIPIGEVRLALHDEMYEVSGLSMDESPLKQFFFFFRCFPYFQFVDLSSQSTSHLYLLPVASDG